MGMQQATGNICHVAGKEMLYDNYGWEKGRYRYALKLSYPNAAGNTLLVVGFNPGGKTDPEADIIGRTITRVIDKASKLYGTFIFVNLSPVVAEHPKGVLADPDDFKRLHQENLGFIRKNLSQWKPDGVLLCYGRSYKKAPVEFYEVLSLIFEKLGDSVQYHCLGHQEKGRYPYHPLARKADLSLEECGRVTENGKFPE